MMDSSRFEGALLDLCAGLWAGLGVPVLAGGEDWAVDPEALILFTSALGDLDPRLRDEAAYWCSLHDGFVSFARLRNLLADETENVRETYGSFAATVQAMSGVRWPGATEPWGFTPIGGTSLMDLGAPQRIVLRLRALFGVGARAEVIRCFLSRMGRSASAAELAAEAGFSKRNVREALVSLRMGGLLEERSVANRLEYRLAHPERLLPLLGAVPARFPRWVPTLRLLGRLLHELIPLEDASPRVRAVQAAALVRDLTGLAQEAGWRTPQLRGQGEEAYSLLLKEALAFVESLRQP